MNMTRGQDVSGGNGGNQPASGSADSIPDAILTLTKNVLGQNVTKSIEPLIKRVGDNDHGIVGDHHRRKKKRDHSTKKESVQLTSTMAHKDSTVSPTIAMETTSNTPNGFHQAAIEPGNEPGYFDLIFSLRFNDTFDINAQLKPRMFREKKVKIDALRHRVDRVPAKI